MEDYMIKKFPEFVGDESFLEGLLAPYLFRFYPFPRPCPLAKE